MTCRTVRIVRVCACILLGTFAGCATVAPYERERLARSDMELDGNPELTAGQQHATAYREGSSGAEGASGGGCGCN
jgi:hypothetical protein